MTSIKSSVPFTPAYPPVDKGHIDSGQARHNPLDKTAGEDAEIANGKGGWKNASKDYRSHANRTRLEHNFLPSDKKIVDDTQANAAIRHPNTAFGPAVSPAEHTGVDSSQVNAHREPSNFEITPDGNGGWTKL